MPEPAPLDLLVRGLDLIRDESRWVQHTAATAETGEEVSPRDARAVCFCARGALGRAQFELRGSADTLLGARQVLDRESRRLFGYGILCVNDGRRGEARQSRSGSHKRVVMAFEEAITAQGGGAPR